MTALQHSIPFATDPQPRLPGVAPFDPADWLQVDEVYAAQMAERDRLIAAAPDAVIALAPEARPAADELLEVVLDHLARDHAERFDVGPDAVRRPDGVTVPLDRDDPMGTLGRLVQEDLCLMEARGAEHVLTGAVLCFPASWRLDEKFMRPLLGIHDPVEVYTEDLARRVQRLFDGIRPGRPLWRFNALRYADPALHQPRSIHDRRPERRDPDSCPYLRSERQCLVRLPRTQAVVFSIHTYVVKA